MSHETMKEMQLEREDSFRKSAADLYIKRMEIKRGSEQPLGNKLCRSELVIMKLADAIEKMVADHEAGKAGGGNPGVAVKYLRLLDPVAVALLTVRVVLDAAHLNQRLSRTAVQLASVINDHYNFDQLEQQAPGLVVHVQHKHRRRNPGKHKSTIMRRTLNLVDVVGLDWHEGDRLKLGAKLIELMCTSTGLFTIQHIKENHNKSAVILSLNSIVQQVIGGDMEANVALMDDTAEDGENLLLKRQMEATEYRPTIIKPKPWTSPTEGGYYTDDGRLSRHSILRMRHGARNEEWANHDLTEVYTALNGMQDTAWRINKGVYGVLTTMWNANDQLGVLPPRDDGPIPERPAHIPDGARLADLDEAMAHELKLWKTAARKQHDENHANQSKVRSLDMQLVSAEELLQWDEFYFPHNIDFRGRAYPLPPMLNPQSDGPGRALLEFAQGKPLGESGAYWFLVHIANVFGVDKVSFDERVRWVEAHEAELLDSGMNPLDGARFWTTADDPWGALAACFEYAGYKMVGFEYVSYLPIAMDGSCSGLQHFSAMLRDEVGGAAVNLLPTDEPTDLYTQVSEKVEAELAQSKYDYDLVAQAWRGNVTRKIVKRPCMTFAYSVTSRGMMAQIRDELHKSFGEGALPGFDNHEAAIFLAPIVERAIKGSVIKAAEGMDYLRKVCQLVSGNDMPMVWFAPTGLPVVQEKKKYTSKKHKIWFGGERMRITLVTPTKKLDKVKQKSSIAPNFIHSLDAAHLMKVVNTLGTQGAHHFSMIHDSFGVHACDIPLLNLVIREEFIKLYEVDHLAAFTEQALARLPMEEHENMPALPRKGKLDLSAVLESDFFFS